MIQDTTPINEMTANDMQCDLQSIGYDSTYLDTLSDNQIIELFYNEFGR